ncbi:cytochrome c oxidase assembly protein [Aestuariimicrobium sp. p3-SID1156]|uniref:cytochrome c oxidase assembly protein n=1 Tax=Aestuariimicrobium sp. p3-SID1156 TaxID=2916038 RepID=UPI00223B459B|nr:cytochrome c oxidase assembly protein [Aestuariimicrobium sp. p3-SID1156]MCT1458710.1 cytochrome c oxidase assembly protein [Aestuariimicrobium sp. p3-SID1156]
MRGIGKATVAALASGFVLALAAVVWAVQADASLAPLPGRSETDPGTNLAAGMTRLATWAAGLGTLTLLAMAAFGRHSSVDAHSAAARAHRHEQDERAHWLTRTARFTSLLWFVASIVGVFTVTAADARLPLGYVAADLGTHISASQTAQLWVLAAILVFLVSVILGFSRSLGGVAAAGYLSLLALLPPVVVGFVSVGADHDFATDAMILLTLAASAWWPLAIATALTRHEAEDQRPAEAEALRRYRRISTPASLMVFAGAAVVSWQAMAGFPVGEGSFGLARLLLVVTSGFLAVLSVARLVTRNDALTRQTLPVDIFLGLVQVGLWVASEALTPPRYSIPQDTQTNYLGYTINTPPTFWTLIGPGRPNVLLVTIALFAIGAYVLGFVILRRRGDRWPVTRLVWWIVGWMVMLAITATGLWSYGGASFSLHMITHMTANMMAPVLIVMGAPITLALRVLPDGDHRGTRGTRELLQELLAWKPLEYLLHPLAVWFYFVSSFYILYFTELFGTLMRYHWGHQLMTVHFLITGMLFYGLVIGEDRPPRPLPHVGKIGFLFAAMPFHAFFAVTMMSSPRLFGGDFYRALDVPWVKDLMADQHTGGSITWASGEIPMVIVILFLLVQWQRQERREASRFDRAQDTGLDDSFDSYNEMLARLAERDKLDAK